MSSFASKSVNTGWYELKMCTQKTMGVSLVARSSLNFSSSGRNFESQAVDQWLIPPLAPFEIANLKT